MSIEKLSILVKKFRESRNLTIMQLSEISGLGNGTIGDIESGRSNGSKKSLDKIASALNLSKEERIRLDNSYMGRDITLNTDPRAKNLNSREKKQYDSFMEDTVMYFNDETISFEDKEKFFNSLQDAFFEIKIANKRKK